MAEISVKNWRTGEIIFRHDCEDNTIKKTVEEAVRQRVSLAWAYLSEEDLRGADLRGADLYRARLCRADLREADLRKANLFQADLRGADSYRARLCRADLCLAHLQGVMQFTPEEENRRVARIHDYLVVGCKTYLVRDWRRFTDRGISAMNPYALAFWNANKDVIMRWAETA